jgi:Phage integrase, N-terminal SAM-like domain
MDHQNLVSGCGTTSESVIDRVVVLHTYPWLAVYDEVPLRHGPLVPPLERRVHVEPTRPRHRRRLRARLDGAVDREAAAKNPKTVRSYLDSVRALHKFLVAQGMPADAEGVDAPHLRAFLLAEERRTSAVSAAVHFRNLRVFFGWLATEDERANPNPIARVEGPKVSKSARRPSRSSPSGNCGSC